MTNLKSTLKPLSDSGRGFCNSWKMQLKYEKVTLSDIIIFMKKNKRITKKKTTYMILCFEILLIITLLVGIVLYIYSQNKSKVQTTGKIVGESIEKTERTQPEETGNKPLIQGEKIENYPADTQNETIQGEEIQAGLDESEQFLLENTAETYAEGVKYFEPQNEGEVVLAFAGDILFDDEYSIMASMKQRSNGIYDTISPDLLNEMTSADIFMLNNEFTYTLRGEPTFEKQFTFRADPETAEYLLDMGVDIVSLANNHAYDYGEISLLDSIDTLAAMQMPYVGAGRNLEEASSPFYFETNGMKIGILSSTQIERLDNPDTKGATENSAGVFRSWDGTLLYEKVKEVAEQCDFLVVYVHWGTENTTELDWAQKEQARKLVESGADLVIGNHAHCLQGIEVIDGVPVFYSLGNFLFNSKTLDTCLVKATVKDGKIESLQFIPALQTECKTKLLTGSEKERVIAYMQTLSNGVRIDEEGFLHY